MIKQLRWKFVAIAMGSLLIILLTIIGLINGISFYQIDERADHLLNLLSEHGGSFPKVEPGREKPRSSPPGFGMQFSEETPFETRYFWANADADGSIQQLDTSHIAAITSDQARSYAQQALLRGKTTGYMESYKYQITQQESGTLIVFLDRSTQIESGLFFLLVSCVVAAAVLLVMFVLLAIASNWAIRPVTKSIQKQKQFITDAGHEIKTPLAIISANADVLELQMGKNEWLDSIRNQTTRLGRLVKDLLLLAKMDEERPGVAFARFDVSMAVTDAAMPFCALAEANGKSLSLQIQPGLILLGDMELMRQLVGILLDNAVKYALPNSEIQLALQQAGHTVRLSVSNLCDPVPEGDLNRLFDRFYRADPSRTRETGGYGIGLSIAQAIVQLHRGKLSAQTEGSKIQFTAAFD